MVLFIDIQRISLSTKGIHVSKPTSSAHFLSREILALLSKHILFTMNMRFASDLFHNSSGASILFQH